jgi:succinate dehydrogenase / fumarate reductase, membrane anchor subunit
MNSSYRTPLAKARGLGSAKEGVGHFIQQRVSALALIVLVPWFVISAVLAVPAGYEGARQWMAQPWNAIALILLSGAAFFHMRLGMQVVIEDYIHGHGMKQALLILNTFVAIALFAATAMSVLKVWIGS